jgi:hypothetical protein
VTEDDHPHEPDPHEPELPEEIVRWEQHRREHPRELSRWEIPMGRRAFLLTVGAGLGALTFLSRASGVSRSFSNAAKSLGVGDGWRIYAVSSPMPTFDPATFELKVSGLVERPMTLRWTEVLQLPQTRHTADFHCVTGWSVMDVHWEGIAPRDIIDLVKPKRHAGFVSMVSAEEPYVDQVTLDQFLAPGNLLAHRMDGKPLTREHGAPLRMVIPAMYGYKGVKWVKELVFGDEMQPGYWEQRGYDADAFVGRSNGR